MSLRVVCVLAHLCLRTPAHVESFANEEFGSSLSRQADTDHSFGYVLAFVQLSAQTVTPNETAGIQEPLSPTSVVGPMTASRNSTLVADTANTNHGAALLESKAAVSNRTHHRNPPHKVAKQAEVDALRAQSAGKKLVDSVDVLRESGIALGMSVSALAMLLSPLTLMLGYLLWRKYGEEEKSAEFKRTVSMSPTGAAATLSIEEAIEQVGIGRVQWTLLILCGLTFTSDAAEITFLSFVTEVLRCEWGLTNTQEAAISSAVFVGMLVGCPIWGWYADHYGRREAFLLSSLVITSFGFATALVPNVECLMLARAVVGFGVAGLPVGFDILAEALPAKGRGTFLLYIEFFWTAGSIYVIVCAHLSLERVGWQLLTALSAVPTLVATLFAFVCLPESPRWLVETGRLEEAINIINSWARTNRSPVRVRELRDDSEQHAGDSSADAGYFWRTMRLMSTVWFAFGVAYYGIVLLIPRLFEASAATDAVANACLVTFDYKDIATSSCAEVLGTILALLLIDRAGRCVTQAATYGAAALFFSCLAFGGIDVKVLLAAASCVRLCLMAASCATWVHTPELFPTHQRAEAHSICNLMSKVGAACSPFLVGGAFSTNATAAILAGITVTAAIMASLLPETAGKEI